VIFCTISGNLGRDAELKTLGSGKTVCNFSVATKHKEQTTWVRCALWGARGEKLSRYLLKGTKVAVAGELTTREHDGKTYLEIDVSGVDLMGGGAPKAEASEQATSDELPF
jgi:single-strand DNA-binding protein